jgi:phytoene dehydrogenase-like protein
MTDGLDRLFPGLSDHVTSYIVYDPTRYEREFGLRPFVCGTLPELNNRRFLSQTPVPNLFCVGDSVQPDRLSVPQAMEFGILCAQRIAEQLVGDQRQGPHLPGRRFAGRTWH